MKNVDISVQKLSHSVKSLIFAIILTAMFIVTSASFTAVSAQRIPTPGVGGNFSDMQVDGDRVKVLSTSVGGESGKILIQLDADGDWWRMLRVKDKNNTKHSIEQEKGGYVNRVELIEINANDLDTRFKLEFWKAKFFGAHTRVMTEQYRKRDFVGKVIKFIWREGLEDNGSDFSENMRAPINMTVKANGKNATIVSTNNGTVGFATINFRTGFAWWTAIKIFERGGKERLIQKVKGRYSPRNRTIRIPLNRLPSEIKLEFWTAKALGVHTHMVTKKLIRERFDGRVVTITWGNAVAPINYSVKADGRTARITSTDTGSPGWTTIRFRTNKDWWTALQFYDRRGRMKTIARENGRYKRGWSTIRIPIIDLPSNVKLELWTAKAFGVHTYMNSKTIANDRFDGRVITVTWNK